MFFINESNTLKKVLPLLYACGSGDILSNGQISTMTNVISMDNSLLSLYKAGRITEKTALQYATNPDMLQKKL